MIDELLLQKLVDGELDNDQIRMLLRDADQIDVGGERSSRWKQMAVAFVENQMTESGFLDFETKDRSTEAGGKMADSARVNASPMLVGGNEEVKRDSSRTLWTFVLAASLLVATSILYHQLPAGVASDTSERVASIRPENSLTPDDGDHDRLPNFDHRTLLTLKPDRHLEAAQLPTAIGEKVRQQVPLYDANRFDRQQLSELRNNDMATRRAWADQVMPASGISDQLAADYEKAGLMIDQDIEFLSGRLDDGRAYLIPYRTVRFTSGQ